MIGQDVMNNHPKWGNPRDFQIEASLTGSYWTEIEVPETRLFGFFVEKSGKKKVRLPDGEYSTKKGDVIPDDIEARREFKYRCGLIKAINVLSGSKSTMTLYLDGFPNVVFEIEKTEFKFDPQLENGPVAEIFYRGFCTRRGEMKHGRTDTFAYLIFKDQGQMKEFVIATTTTPDPEQKTTYRSRNSGGGSCLWPFAAGLLLGVAID